MVQLNLKEENLALSSGVGLAGQAVSLFWEGYAYIAFGMYPDEIINSRLLHIDGYDTEAAAFAARTAQKNGIPVSLDVDTVYPGFEAVLKHVDFLVAGSGWPAKWTGETDPFLALNRLQREYHFKVAAMTVGDSGALALQDNQWFYSPAFQVSCVDTTGAGDAFHGAFCYAMVRGLPLDSALEFSNAAAALNCTAIGARGHIPVLLEIEALLASAAAGNTPRRLLPEMAERCSSLSSGVMEVKA